MNFKKSIVSLLNMVICFALMIVTVNAGVDDDVSVYPFDLGFEITSYANVIETPESEEGMTFTLLSSSNEAYVYFHRNINQDLSSFNGIYFDIQNPSYEALSLTITISPGIGYISTTAPFTDVGKITYIEGKDDDDNDFWHQDDRDGDGHYDKEVEDNDDDDLPTGFGIIPGNAYFVTHSTSSYFTTNLAQDGMITIPAGFNGRVYVPFFSLGRGSELVDLVLNNISSIGFTVISTNGLSQNFVLQSYGKYSYANNHLLEQAKTGFISGSEILSIPSVGVTSSKQSVQGLSPDIEYRYESVSNDSFVIIMDLEEEVIGIYPRALAGYFSVRVWVNDVVCLEKIIGLTKATEGISSVVAENRITDGAYISFFVYIKQLVEYYRYYFLIFPISFALIVLSVFSNKTKDKSKENDGGIL